MSLKKKIANIQNKISGKILFDINLSKFSWFNLGGPAKILFKPDNLKDLLIFLKFFKRELPIKVLGVGSNVLIRDGGFDGVIIKFGKSFSHISLFDEESLIVGTSLLDKYVANFASKNSLSGLEFLSCIPGTIGGAIRMNSGCYGCDISTNLLSVQAVDLNGNLKVIPSSKIKFYYRGSDLDEDLIFVSATLKGTKNKKKIIEKKMELFIKQKKLTQPSNIKTCGSTFKNPEQNTKKKAWELIKMAKCEEMNIRGATISGKHCNFFVNSGQARAKDLENLILTVQKKVLKKTGINLEPEIQIIGEAK